MQYPSRTTDQILDTFFSYSERVSFFDTVLARKRIAHLLDTQSPLYFLEDDVLAWVSPGGASAFMMFIARDADALENRAAALMAFVRQSCLSHGVDYVQCYTISPRATQILCQQGFKRVAGARRLRLTPIAPTKTAPAIRPLERSDLPALVAISQARFPEQKWSDPEWARALEGAPIARVYVSDAGEAVAYCMGIMQASSLILTGIATAETHAGKGIGKQLVDAMGNLACEHGIHTLDVHSAETPATLHFYHRLGFVEQHPVSFLDWRPH